MPPAPILAMMTQPPMFELMSESATSVAVAAAVPSNCAAGMAGVVCG